MTIAIDFDDTCAFNKYPHIGDDVPHAEESLKLLVSSGAKLILYTMRDGQGLTDAINWFKDRDIPLYGIQTNPTQRNWTKSNKCDADLYIDDKGLGCPSIKYSDKRRYVDWPAVIVLLKNIYNDIS